eukprot:Anaeramoba_flamelloidesa1056881_52.p1 GENE.a1056881_52~~a1056881_52.p1  ORF type:complete len:522 (-),score=112.88 a1056881_52:1369-2934(-)
MNLGLLDNFVCEYLFDRGYLTNTNSVGMRALNSNKKQVDLLQNIKTSLLEGDIEAVISQLASLDHLLLEKNKALLFSLQLHHFKEILYKKGREEALTFLREVLVHLALISTSTSYEEFKSQMTLLLYDEETLNETLPKERQELVSSVHTPLLKSLQIEETLFTNILAYLVYIHNYKHVMTGTTTEYPEIEQILLGERTHVDPGEIIRFREQEPERFQEISNNLQENDVTLLCESVHISREQALQSLILSNNDLQSAFRREIKRIQLNHKFLSKLCLQYAQFRGLIQKNKNSKPNENQKEKTIYSQEKKKKLIDLRRKLDRNRQIRYNVKQMNGNDIEMTETIKSQFNEELIKIEHEEINDFTEFYKLKGAKIPLVKNPNIDRSAWRTQILNKHKKIRMLREQINPINRCESFVKIYQPGIKQVVEKLTNEEILQLIMHHMIVLGYQKAVEAIEEETNVKYQPKYLHDSRLHSILRNSIKRSEKLWDLTLTNEVEDDQQENNNNNNNNSTNVTLVTIKKKEN